MTVKEFKNIFKSLYWWEVIQILNKRRGSGLVWNCFILKNKKQVTIIANVIR